MKALSRLLKALWAKLGLVITLAFFVGLAWSQINIASENCVIDQWLAKVNYRNQEDRDLGDLLINELPQNLTYSQIEDLAPWLYFDPTKALDNEFAEFSFNKSQLEWSLMQEVYWFGSTDYALCKFNRSTKNFIIVPEVLELGKEGVSHNKNIFGIDAVTCNGLRGYRGIVGCVWVGLYENYITVVTARIEPDVITYEDDIAIMSQVDQKMKSELGIR